MTGPGRTGPDPDRPGTVYRARPRLRRPGSRSGDGSGSPQGPPPDNPAAHPPYSQGAYPTPQDPYAAYPPPPYPPPGQDAYPPGPPPPGARPPAGRGRGRPGGLPPGARTARRRRWPWVTALVLLVVVVYPLLLGLRAWTSLHTVKAFPASGRPAETPGRTFLVVGSDSRQDLTRDERDRLGTGTAAGQRTDTIMLLHVPDGGGPTVLVSVPRDSYVAIPGHGKNKINSAYAFGGPQLLVRTVEQATGLHVDQYVETGLGGYADLVDAIGGVRVCVKKAMKDPKAHIDLKPGCQDMDGKTALGYARSRYTDPARGDLSRVEHQRQVLAAIAGKTLSPGVILMPWRGLPAAGAGGGALTVNEGTSPYGVAQFVLAMRSVAGGDGLQLTVPVSGNITTAAAGEALQWDGARSGALFAALRRDDTAAVRPLADEQKKATGA